MWFGRLVWRDVLWTATEDLQRNTHNSIDLTNGIQKGLLRSKPTSYCTYITDILDILSPTRMHHSTMPPVQSPLSGCIAQWYPISTCGNPDSGRKSLDDVQYNYTGRLISACKSPCIANSMVVWLPAIKHKGTPPPTPHTHTQTFSHLSECLDQWYPMWTHMPAWSLVCLQHRESHSSAVQSNQSRIQQRHQLCLYQYQSYTEYMSSKLCTA